MTAPAPETARRPTLTPVPTVAAWGDIPEAQYRVDRADVERELRLLPTEDRLVLFDQHRTLVLSIAEEVMEADLDMLRTLAQRVVGRGRARSRRTTRFRCWWPGRAGR